MEQRSTARAGDGPTSVDPADARDPPSGEGQQRRPPKRLASLKQWLTPLTIIGATIVGLAQLLGISSNRWWIAIAVIAAVAASLVKLLDSSTGLQNVWHLTGLLASIPLLLGVLWWVEGRETRREDDLKDRATGPQVFLAGGLVVVDGDEIAAEVDQPPQATVADFVLDQFEVTNARYLACVDADVCDPPADEAAMRDPLRAEWPVGEVSAAQAAEFCEWLGRRLPTELEWLRAALGRASEQREWPWGDESPTPDRANVDLVTGITVDPFDDPDAFDRRARDEAEADQAPAVVRDPVPVTELDAGRTPDDVANLFGNVAEWTSTSAELCSLRFDCSTPWRPGVEVKTLVVRGDSFASVVVLADQAARPQIHRATSAIPSLQEKDLGFRCAVDQ